MHLGLAMDEDFDPVSSCLAMYTYLHGSYIFTFQFSFAKVGMEIVTGYTNVCTYSCSPIMEPAIC